MRGEAAGIARLWDAPETLPLIRRCGATFPRRGKALRKEERTIQTYLEQAFGKSDVTSAKMRAALREWLDLYYGAPRPGEDAAPRLAALIVGKLCRTVFAEYETRLPPAAPEAVQRSLEALNAAARTAMQYALVGGECLLKPVPADGGFDFTAIRRDCYVPLARDAHGRLLAVGTMERHSCDGRQYALLERRTAGAEGLTIETRLFELNGQVLGRCVPLSTLPACAALVPQLMLPGVQGVGLAVLRMVWMGDCSQAGIPSNWHLLSRNFGMIRQRPISTQRRALTLREMILKLTVTNSSRFIWGGVILCKYQRMDYALYFGRFSEEKGIGTLIKVCKELPDVQFIFAGTGPLEETVNGIKNIKNVGFQKGEALEKLIREARFTIYPSEWYENCPFSVMESQMYGTPVLGANIGGIPELIRVGKTGELFESGNAEDLKKKIEKLWGDEKLCEQYSKNCKDISFDTIGEYYEKIMKVYQ